MSLPSCAIIMFYVNWNNESMQKKHMEYIQIFKELSQIYIHRTVSRTSICTHSSCSSLRICTNARTYHFYFLSVKVRNNHTQPVFPTITTTTTKPNKQDRKL